MFEQGEVLALYGKRKDTAWNITTMRECQADQVLFHQDCNCLRWQETCDGATAPSDNSVLESPLKQGLTRTHTDTVS